jgi:asparagine synthase (glutamine-hydrolysing)
MRHSRDHFRYRLAVGLQYDMMPAQLHSADRSAMAFSVETRFPFLDYELVDWCIGLPDEALIRNGWLKYVLRESAEGLLPREIQWRADKVGFAAPQDQWLRRELKEWAHDRLFSGEVTRLESYRRTDLWKAWLAHQSGRVDHSWLLWRWISLSEWMECGRRRLWTQPVSTDRALQGPHVKTDLHHLAHAGNG